MRVSSLDRYSTAVDSLQRRQQQLSDVQQQMTTGKRIAKPSDDPTALARAERAFAAQQRIEAQQHSVDASRSAMQLVESTLGQANEVLQTARETVVSAGNGSYTSGERAAQVDALRNLRAQLLGLANQSDGAGGYVFGGQGATSAPFLDQPGGVVSVNTPGAMQLSPSEIMPTTMDGQQVWLAASSGNGVFVSSAGAQNTGSGWVNAGSVSDPSALTGSNYEIQFSKVDDVTTFTVVRDGTATSLVDQPFHPGESIVIDGQSVNVSGAPADGDSFSLAPSTRTLDVFQALDRIMATLSNPNAKDSQVIQAVNLGLRDLDSVMRQMQGARAEAGATLSRLDAIDNRNEDRKLWATTVQSDAEDADMVEVISAFQSQQTGYQAALQSYATVQRMSLFDYIK